MPNNKFPYQFPSTFSPYTKAWVICSARHARISIKYAHTLSHAHSYKHTHTRPNGGCINFAQCASCCQLGTGKLFGKCYENVCRAAV